MLWKCMEASFRFPNWKVIKFCGEKLIYWFYAVEEEAIAKDSEERIKRESEEHEKNKNENEKRKKRELEISEKKK